MMLFFLFYKLIIIILIFKSLTNLTHKINFTIVASFGVYDYGIVLTGTSIFLWYSYLFLLVLDYNNIVS